MRFFDGHLTSRWREVSESEFRMPPTCPERSEGSSQIRGLAPRSIRAYALKDTSLPLSRQRLTTVSAFSFALAAFGSSSFARPLTPVIAANHNTICVADGAPGHKPSCVSEVQSNLTTPPDSALGAIDVALGGTHACAIVQSNAKDGKSEERGITCWGQTAMHLLEAPATSLDSVPSSIKTGAFYTCAMFQNKTSQRSVQCWGADLGVINGIPKFNAPILSIASLPSDMCAYLANKTIQCWGEHGNNSSDATSAEWMESATPTCSYDTGSKLNCAPSLEMNLQNSKPLQTSSWIVKPMQIAFAKSCKSAEDVVSCNTFNFAAKGKVLSLAISKSKVCALHSDGVTCYNEKTKSIAELALPGQFISSQLILKEPLEIFGLLQVLATKVYKFDADMFLAILDGLYGANTEQCELTLKALSPLLSSIAYQSLVSQLPNMRTSIAAVTTVDVTASPAKRKILFDLLNIILRTARPVLLRVQDHQTDSQAKRVEQAIAEVGMASAQNQPLSSQTVQDIETIANELAINPYVGPRSASIRWILNNNN